MPGSPRSRRRARSRCRSPTRWPTPDRSSRRRRNASRGPCRWDWNWVALLVVAEPIRPARTPGLVLVAITEAAAIAAAHWLGHGDNRRADQAAVEAMRKA